MVDCGYCVACLKKKEYNLNKTNFARMKYDSWHKKEIDDHTYKVMLAHWLRDKTYLFY
jgi:hypothetical protein